MLAGSASLDHDVGVTSLPKPPTKFSKRPWQLRLVGLADWPLEAAMSQDPDVVRWTFYPSEASEAVARDWVRTSVARAAAGDGYRYTITGPDGTVGVAGIVTVGERGHPEVFYALLAEGRGTGAATATVACLTEWLLSQQRVGRVDLVTVAGNGASERVAARCGYSLTGEEPGEHRGETVLLRTWSVTRLGAEPVPPAAG